MFVVSLICFFDQPIIFMSDGFESQFEASQFSRLLHLIASRLCQHAGIMICEYLTKPPCAPELSLKITMRKGKKESFNLNASGTYTTLSEETLASITQGLIFIFASTVPSDVKSVALILDAPSGHDVKIVFPSRMLTPISERSVVFMKSMAEKCNRITSHYVFDIVTPPSPGLSYYTYFYWR